MSEILQCEERPYDPRSGLSTLLFPGGVTACTADWALSGVLGRLCVDAWLP